MLSYAAPPDFTKTDAIGPYEPVVIAPDYARLALAPCSDGTACQELPLSAEGGLGARFVKPHTASLVSANVLLVLQGSCTIGGQAVSADTLIVTKDTEPARYAVAPGSDCLLFQLAFQ